MKFLNFRILFKGVFVDPRKQNIESKICVIFYVTNFYDRCRFNLDEKVGVKR